MLVERNVRRSSRPCPLSVVLATRPGAGAGAWPSGGKGGGHRPGRRLVAEAGRHVRLQAGLVLLDQEQVVAPPLDDLRAEVALAEQGVADDDAALDRQDAQQLQGGLVLVGL